MQEATPIEPESLNDSLRLPRISHDLRPVVPVVLYLITYAAIDLVVDKSGLLPILGDYSMTAGLNFGLLLLHSIWYAPVVFLATVTDGLWLHPLPYPVPLAIIHSFTIALIQIVTATMLKQLISGHCVTLKKRQDFVWFALIGAVASITLAITASMHNVLADTIQWSPLLLELRMHLICFATGIFCITPVLVIHVSPWLEAVLFGIKTEKQPRTKRSQPVGINRYGATFTTSFVILAGLALYLVLGIGITEELYIFLLLSLPLIWVATQRGLEGLSVAIPLLMLVSIAAIQSMGRSAALMEPFLALLVSGSLYASMIAVGVTQNRVTQRQMERRDAILDAVSFAAQQFLGNAGWETGIQEVVRRLGEATAVTRVFLIDNRTPDLGGQVGDASLYEWTNPSVSAEESEKRVLNLLRSQMIGELSDNLSAGQPCLFRTKDMSRKRQEMLETFGIRSGVIIPMFIEHQWWGCLGLEQCFVDRDWPKSEIDGLNRAGQILGTIFASVRVEQQFRQLTGNIQAVFWISDPDGLIKEYVSPGYEEIWGQTCASLQRDPQSWLKSIHPEDRSRVLEALIKQVWGEYDEEFRVERQDGSIRWVHDRAFPVRDQSGKVTRIVGIAADITKEKHVEEQLRDATAMLSSLINHLHSGIMVEDVARRITHVNETFNKTFNIPIPPQSLFGIDSRLVFAQTATFAERIEQVIKKGVPVLGEEIEWKGRLFLRNYVPLSMNESNHYHLWQYQDITDRRQAEAQIKASLKEKEVLLKEIHHRVKNNLQIISSLLNLQSAEIEDPIASQKFRDSQDRVKAMALIHERLYQSSDLAKVDFSGYVRGLTGHLLRSYNVNSNAIRLNLEVAPMLMNLDVAIPCGLVINELVSNALKYAFPQPGDGEIKIHFCDGDDGALKLVVRDNGIGFPDDWNPEKSDSLGLKLVRTLTEQLGGRVQYRNQNGFLCEINIPQAKN